MDYNMNNNQGKNARQHVEDVKSQLECAKNCLNEAMNSVEKPENRERIQGTLNEVNNALKAATNTLVNM